MSISEHIARSTNLVVNDPHYTWAGTQTLSLDSPGTRLVQVNLDKPEVLSWAVTIQNMAQPTQYFDPAKFCAVKVTAGVSRAFISAQGELLGAYTGQVCAQTLQISVSPLVIPAGPHRPTDSVQVTCLVTRGTAPVLAWPSQARLTTLSDPAGAAVTIAATWRRGFSVHNLTDPAVAQNVVLEIPQNLDGSGRLVPHKYTVAPGETLALGGYCGPVSVTAAGNGVAFATCCIAEW